MRVLPLPHGVGRLRFHDLPGEAPPLLFVHGLGCASSCDYPRVAADPALAARLQACGVTVRIVADAGHSMAIENPSGYAAVIRAALA